LVIKANLPDQVLQNAQILWDYLRLDQPLHKTDCLLVMGSHDLRVGQYAANLFLQGWSPLLVFSGGQGELTQNLWNQSEAGMFSWEALKLGVAARDMLLETHSTNTGENITFTCQLLQEKGLDPASFTLVHKPYMERRALATFQKVWPKKQAWVTSPPIPFEEYPTGGIPLESVINIMVGDFQRILDYPDLGFQVQQEVPDEAMLAYYFLLERGFDQHLLRMAGE